MHEAGGGAGGSACLRLLVLAVTGTMCPGNLESYGPELRVVAEALSRIRASDYDAVVLIDHMEERRQEELMELCASGLVYSGKVTGGMLEEDEVQVRTGSLLYDTLQKMLSGEDVAGEVRT